MQSINQEQELAQLRWRCRRGMLELDIFLQGFFDAQYLSLSADNKMRFQQLLAQPDPDIYAWLMGYETPENADDQQICQMIRAYVDQLSVSD